MKKKPWEGPGAANERAGGHLISAESVGETAVQWPELMLRMQ